MERDELVEHAAVHGGDGRGAMGRALEQQDGPRVVAELEMCEARRVELQPRAARRVLLDLRFVRQRAAQRGGVAVGRQVAHVGRADGADAGVDGDRPLERAARGVDAPEPPLEDVGLLDVEPRGQLGGRRVRIGHPPQVNGERVVRFGAARQTAGSGERAARATLSSPSQWRAP